MNEGHNDATVGSGVPLILLPFVGSVFGCPPRDLLDVTFGPLLLMLLFSPIKIIGDATMDDLVTDLQLDLYVSRRLPIPALHHT